MAHEECLMKDKWAEQAATNERILERLDEIKAMGIDTHEKLFVGNGEPALVRKVDRHDLMLNAGIFVVCAIAVAVIGLVANVIYAAISK